MITKKYKEINNIKIFHDDIHHNHQDYNAQGLDNLFREEEKHFWFISRKEFICQEMKKFLPLSSTIIEIGAGTGNVARFLKQNNYLRMSVGEMHHSGLQYARSYGIEACYQFDLLRTPFINEFDTVCMFDVLEHIEEDDNAIQNTHKMLKGHGTIVLTVPAHMWLWNREDAIAGHKTRYTKSGLIHKLEKHGFEIITAKYFFISITPLLYLRTILHKDTKTAVAQDEFDIDISVHPIVNKILLFISRLENKLNKYLPNLFGGSLLVIAKKK